MVQYEEALLRLTERGRPAQRSVGHPIAPTADITNTSLTVGMTIDDHEYVERCITPFCPHR